MLRTLYIEKASCICGYIFKDAKDVQTHMVEHYISYSCIIEEIYDTAISAKRDN